MDWGDSYRSSSRLSSPLMSTGASGSAGGSGSAAFDAVQRSALQRDLHRAQERLADVEQEKRLAAIGYEERIAALTTELRGATGRVTKTEETFAMLRPVARHIQCLLDDQLRGLDMGASGAAGASALLDASSVAGLSWTSALVAGTDATAQLADPHAALLRSLQLSSSKLTFLVQRLLQGGGGAGMVSTQLPAAPNRMLSMSLSHSEAASLRAEVSSLVEQLRLSEDKQTTARLVSERAEREVLQLQRRTDQKIREYASSNDRLRRELQEKCAELATLREHERRERRESLEQMETMDRLRAQLDSMSRDNDFLREQVKEARMALQTSHQSTLAESDTLRRDLHAARMAAAESRERAFALERELAQARSDGERLRELAKGGGSEADRLRLELKDALAQVEGLQQQIRVAELEHTEAKEALAKAEEILNTVEQRQNEGHKLLEARQSQAIAAAVSRAEAMLSQELAQASDKLTLVERERAATEQRLAEVEARLRDAEWVAQVLRCRTESELAELRDADQEARVEEQGEPGEQRAHLIRLRELEFHLQARSPLAPLDQLASVSDVDHLVRVRDSEDEAALERRIAGMRLAELALDDVRAMLGAAGDVAPAGSGADPALLQDVARASQQTPAWLSALLTTAEVAYLEELAADESADAARRQIALLRLLELGADGRMAPRELDDVLATSDVQQLRGVADDESADAVVRKVARLRLAAVDGPDWVGEMVQLQDLEQLEAIAGDAASSEAKRALAHFCSQALQMPPGGSALLLDDDADQDMLNQLSRAHSANAKLLQQNTALEAHVAQLNHEIGLLKHELVETQSLLRDLDDGDQAEGEPAPERGEAEPTTPSANGDGGAGAGKVATPRTGESSASSAADLAALTPTTYYDLESMKVDLRGVSRLVQKTVSNKQQLRPIESEIKFQQTRATRLLQEIRTVVRQNKSKEAALVKVTAQRDRFEEKAIRVEGELSNLKRAQQRVSTA